MAMEREARNGSEGPVENGEEKRPAFKPIQALPPILLMGVFIVVTVGLSLIVGPLYDSYGLSSDFEEFAQGDYWYLYAFGFVVLMVVVALVILLLRKLLKRRKLKLKYLFAFVVFTSTFVVVQPFVDMAFNGAPPVWERYDMDVDGAESAYPLDPADIGSGFIILTNSSFHVLVSGRYEMVEVYKVADIDRISPPHFKGGIWVISGNFADLPTCWSIGTDGTVSTLGVLNSSYEGMEFMGAQMEIVEGDLYVVGLWSNATDVCGTVYSMDDLSRGYDFEIDIDENDPGPFQLVQGWTYLEDNYLLSGNGSHRFDIEEIDESIIISNNTKGDITSYGSGFSRMINTSWGTCQGDNVVFFTRAEHWNMDMTGEDPPLTNPHFRFADKGNIIDWNGRPTPTTVFYYEHGNSYTMDLIEGNDYYLLESDDQREQDNVIDGGIGLFREPYFGPIWIVETENIWRGEFSFEERGQLHVQIISFLIGAVLVIALLKKPKWWLVDLGGLLMGAGVIAIMGISFPILFTLLLLVLLAIYDYISVYKTKHMIALADSVVEAKMPILLVFPMKWSYRYEDETNLMDPKRKRESLFMGLGDVIIPGILILSIASFLSPVGGVRLFGFIYPPVAVALFALAGMLAGWGTLMFFVIKGKAHAGLPPINSGTILGFILGHFIIYGTIVFW